MKSHAFQNKFDDFKIQDRYWNNFIKNYILIWIYEKISTIYQSSLAVRSGRACVYVRVRVCLFGQPVGSGSWVCIRRMLVSFSSQRIVSDVEVLAQKLLSVSFALILSWSWHHAHGCGHWHRKLWRSLVRIAPACLELDDLHSCLLLVYYALINF